MGLKCISCIYFWYGCRFYLLKRKEECWKQLLKKIFFAWHVYGGGSCFIGWILLFCFCTNFQVFIAARHITKIINIYRYNKSCKVKWLEPRSNAKKNLSEQNFWEMNVKKKELLEELLFFQVVHHHRTDMAMKKIKEYVFLLTLLLYYRFSFKYKNQARQPSQPNRKSKID